MPIVPLPGTSEKFTEESVNPEAAETSKWSDWELWTWYCERIERYLDCPSWKCPECGCVNFGRNAFCPYCKQRLGKLTTRPPGKGCEEKAQWK